MNADLVPDIPGYTLIRRIGSGAMASVYLAVQESLERQVALKVMSPSLAIDPTFRQRFLREGKIIAKLNHPHIIRIHDIGVQQAHHYMAMEYVEGGDLKDRIENGLTPDQAVNILCQVAKALSYAHAQGFVHRDVKPANVLFRADGSVVLSDFGIAKGFADQSQMTAVGLTLGTPNYMSPEQALGKPLDARSDFYSLGVVFYEMLTGTKPYEGTDALSTVLKHVESPIPRLPQHLSAYEPIIDRLMAKDPNERFANAEALIDAIAALKTTGARRQEASQVSAVEPAAKQPSRLSWRSVWLIIAGLCLALVGTAGYLLRPATPVLLENTLPPSESTPAAPPTASISEPAPTQPPSNCPALDAKSQEQIAGLTKTAQIHEDNGYLDYAADTYRRVLEIDPCASDAQARIQAIVDKIEVSARESLASAQDPSHTLEIIDSGLYIMPDHPGLLSLRKQLER